MTRFPLLGLAFAAALAACGGGGDDDGDGPDDGGELPVDPPTEVEMVASGGFTDPLDAVASPDGATFYFSAFTVEDRQPAIFSVPAAGGEATRIAGGPPLENPSGLLLSADGATLYVADIGVRAGEPGEDAEASTQSVMYSMSTSGSALTPMSVSGIGEAAGLALGPDGETIHVTGYNEAGEPGLFRLPPGSGAAEEILLGAPLESPTGVYVDAEGVSWVMDHHPSRALGGALWAITPSGEASEVIGNLGLSDPGGVSLVAGGGTAVIPNTTEDGAGQLTTVNIDSGEQTVVESSMKAPAGIRTAREAGVFAVADSEGDAIYLAR
jgi:DNA-binding beta-propeller fold protein YncE